jgi:hypothetical protein
MRRQSRQRKTCAGCFISLRPLPKGEGNAPTRSFGEESRLFPVLFVSECERGGRYSGRTTSEYVTNESKESPTTLP